MGFFSKLFCKKKQETLPEENVKNDNNDDQSRKYHVSMNKDTKSEHYKMWRVRKEHSEKTIKYFNTQNEAIEYAEKLAEQADTTVVIHKVDGSIRKQDYRHKE